MRPYGLTALRLCVGAVFLLHGLQKVGLLGPGLHVTTTLLDKLELGPAYPLAVVTAIAELGGGVLLILGALTRWVALALLIEQLVAIYKVNITNSYYLSTNDGPGMEYRLILIGAMLCLAMAGPGALSLDEWRNSSAEAKAAGRARARKV